MDAVRSNRDLADAFEAQRPRLTRLAYRMLGSVAEAQDAVQDAWLRWTKAAATVADPAAWLVRVTTRLCIDRLRAAKAERAAYRGPWLPEPLIEPLTEDPLERAEDVSVAFLLALERLSPLERAVFLLHDVFDEDYATVAGNPGSRTEPAVPPARQPRPRSGRMSARPRPRFSPSARRKSLAWQLAGASWPPPRPAATCGTALVEPCWPKIACAILVSDGGGKRQKGSAASAGRAATTSSSSSPRSPRAWPGAVGGLSRHRHGRIARAARINLAIRVGWVIELRATGRRPSPSSRATTARSRRSTWSGIPTSFGPAWPAWNP